MIATCYRSVLLSCGKRVGRLSAAILVFRQRYNFELRRFSLTRCQLLDLSFTLSLNFNQLLWGLKLPGYASMVNELLQ